MESRIRPLTFSKDGLAGGRKKINARMRKVAPKILTVTAKEAVSLNMLSIVLQGEDLDPDTLWQPGCYVKLLIPDSSDPGGKARARTYTARSFDPQRKTITIEFAIHHPAGPATQWALDAQVGDQIGLKGPGMLKIDPTRGDWHLFAADMSALPAAISVMESLPAYAKGYAFLEITNAADQQRLNIPEGIAVQWLIHPNPKVKSTQQLEAIKQVAILAGVPNVFVAGELSTIREIKDYLVNEDSYDSAYAYISSYWKIGLKEEEHKLAKRNALS